MYCVTRRGLIKYELDSAPAILRKCELNDRVSIWSPDPHNFLYTAKTVTAAAVITTVSPNFFKVFQLL